MRQQQRRSGGRSPCEPVHDRVEDGGALEKNKITSIGHPAAVNYTSTTSYITTTCLRVDTREVKQSHGLLAGSH